MILDTFASAVQDSVDLLRCAGQRSQLICVKKIFSTGLIDPDSSFKTHLLKLSLYVTHYAEGLKKVYFTILWKKKQRYTLTEWQF